MVVTKSRKLARGSSSHLEALDEVPQAHRRRSVKDTRQEEARVAGVDRLRQLQHAVFDVQFGGKADQSHRPGWRDRLCQQACRDAGCDAGLAR
jgi:hypothetical protein